MAFEAFVRVQRSILEVGFLREATFPLCFFKVPIFLDREGCFPERYCSNVLPFINKLYQQAFYNGL